VSENNSNLWDFLKGIITELFEYIGKNFEPKISEKVETVKVRSTPMFGDKGDDVLKLQTALNNNGAALKLDGDFGSKTREAVSVFQKSKGSVGSGIIGPKTLEWLGLEVKGTEETVYVPGEPIYPSVHPFHPRFDSKLPKPYTHLHPFDVARSVAGETEIPGSRHNPFIAHLHEHSGNLGVHSEGADYSDEVPHCSSGLNWCADMSGCEKSNNALAASWSDSSRASYNPRLGDWVEVGDIIHKKTGKQNHVTLCNKRFNKRTAKYYEGFGFNQGNSIKTSTYKVADIKSVQMWKPKKGTHLAPIGFLGTKPVPATGGANESTR